MMPFSSIVIMPSMALSMMAFKRAVFSTRFRHAPTVLCKVGK